MRRTERKTLLQARHVLGGGSVKTRELGLEIRLSLYAHRGVTKRKEVVI